jgi:hypothetical protein
MNLVCCETHLKLRDVITGVVRKGFQKDGSAQVLWCVYRCVVLQGSALCCASWKRSVLVPFVWDGGQLSEYAEFGDRFLCKHFSAVCTVSRSPLTLQ